MPSNRGYLSDDDQTVRNVGRMTRSMTAAHNEPIFKELNAVKLSLTSALDECRHELNNDTKQAAIANTPVLDTEQKILDFVAVIRRERDALFSMKDEIIDYLSAGQAIADELTPDARQLQRDVLDKKQKDAEKLFSEMERQLINMEQSYERLKTKARNAFPDLQLRNMSFSNRTGNTRVARHKRTYTDEGHAIEPSEAEQNPSISSLGRSSLQRREQQEQTNNRGQQAANTANREARCNNVARTTEDNYLLRHMMPEFKIPNYNGDPETWDEFWAMFEALVHNTNHPDIIKFTILRSNLEGRAQDLIRKFKSDGSTYNEAIETLKRTFGNEATRLQAIWEKLKTLPTARDKTRSIRSTYNEACALVASLSKLQLDMNTRTMILDVKLKFPRSVWTELHKIATEFINMNEMLEEIDEIIRVREDLDNAMRSRETLDATVLKLRNTTLDPGDRIQRSPTPDEMNDSAHSDADSDCSEQPDNPRRIMSVSANDKDNPYCIFCSREGHTSTDCRAYPTIQSKKASLSLQKRCFKCLKKGHSSNDCRSRVNCKRCFSATHATVLCQKGSATREEAPNELKRTTWNERNVRPNASFGQDGIENLLMIAQPTIRDDETKELFIVNAMIDTGAENSFIRQDVADDLKLKKLQTDIDMKLVLFGSKKSSMYSDKVEATLVDDSNNETKCHLFTLQNITTPIQHQQLSRADKKFLKKRIKYTAPKGESDIHMVFGIDQFFNVVHFGKQQYKLPSGLHLVPTKFGYIACGANNENPTSRVNTTIRTSSAITEVSKSRWKMENNVVRPRLPRPIQGPSNKRILKQQVPTKPAGKRPQKPQKTGASRQSAKEKLSFSAPEAKTQTRMHKEADQSCGAAQSRKYNAQSCDTSTKQTHILGPFPQKNSSPVKLSPRTVTSTMHNSTSSLETTPKHSLYVPNRDTYRDQCSVNTFASRKAIINTHLDTTFQSGNNTIPEIIISRTDRNPNNKHRLSRTSNRRRRKQDTEGITEKCKCSHKGLSKIPPGKNTPRNPTYGLTTAPENLGTFNFQIPITGNAHLLFNNW